MIRSLLIANRGEIARRVIRTARRLGLRTIAVYSEADSDAPHRHEADEAVFIGPSPADQSYLAGEKIIAAARASGAEAIHPGYGFLSENAGFAEAVLAAGLIWVGPAPAAMRAMGLKDAAKALMERSGVPVTPGYHGDDQSEARLLREARAIGYPVMIKAVAGGGGKGMRKVERPDDFALALSAAKREAQAAFGDHRVLLEKYINHPRHIEVQIFGDKHGHIVHLFERDCSLQRRHQKIIEEAPAPSMDEATRHAVCSAAINAARAVNYEGAGTVEFIADASEGLRPDRIWFMEMNTRLQVEHPVTEMITGLDLVEWQLRVASGEPLPLTQNRITHRGHAIEARLYAENPANGFLPSTGPLTHLEWPDGVRVEAGIEKGGAVTPFYDSMIAKLIAFAPTRDAACAKLAEACGRVEVWPVKTNAGFLARALSHPDFVAGTFDTGFIEARFAALLPPLEEASPDAWAAAAHAWFAAVRAAEPRSPWACLTGFRLNASPGAHIRLQSGAVVHDIYLEPEANPAARGIFEDGQVIVFEAGQAFTFALPQKETANAAAIGGDGVIRAPMPGKIVAVHRKAGDKILKGDVLLILEAMKMEHAIRAPGDGTVARVLFGEGDLVEAGVVLAEIA
jgi:propionyl-CoA carboxylase alpha chain/3-methylcrotonyl-CoA carboxylase alpha subunit